jgi:hypothetical protein
MAVIFFLSFSSVVSYKVKSIPVFHLDTLTNAAGFQAYDSIDEELSFLGLGVPAMFDNLDQDLMTSYNEFLLASLLFYAMKESACSEQSSRMTAMENASKNAGKTCTSVTSELNTSFPCQHDFCKTYWPLIKYLTPCFQTAICNSEFLLTSYPTYLSRLETVVTQAKFISQVLREVKRLQTIFL